MRFLTLLTAAIVPLTVKSLALESRSQDNQLRVQSFQGWSWEDCGDRTDVVHVDSISLSPDPPQPGKNLTVIAKGKVDQTIEEGAFADVTVKIGLIKLLQKRFDVCEEARKSDASIQCPVKADEYTIEQTVALPNEIPRAKFLVQVRGYTTDEDPMLCLNIKIDFLTRVLNKIGF